MSFFGELSRRNVFRVGIAYAIVAWLIVQVADIVFETIGAPTWVMQTLMLGLVLGFFVALIFSWAYEVTPAGVKRESEVDRTQSISGITGRKLDRVITGLLVLALGYFVWESRFAAPDPEPAPIAAVAEESGPGEENLTPVSDLSIAVLPFDNRSNLAADEFFTEGMHDDLLTTLAKIGSMKVISRTSVMEYKDTTKKIPEIANELGVANILEGGVQRAGNQVRINVQLIDANTDEHLWAEIYDRELTAENLFAIQSEISKAIADALHATLSPEEKQRIAATPTDNLEAFDHYLRGRQYMASRTVDDLKRATQEFLAAVEIDPQFALAWVGVADSHGLLLGYGDLPEGTFDSIRDDAVYRALDLDPSLGQAYASLGILLHQRGELGAAEEAFKTAIRYSPNYSTAHQWLANLLKRSVARGPEALAYAQRAVELDPNSAIILGNLADVYLSLGDFEKSERYYDQLLETHPDFASAYDGYADVLEARGDFVGAIEAQRKVVELDPDSLGEATQLVLLYAEIGAFEEAEGVHRSMQERFAGRPLIRVLDSVIALAKGEKPKWPSAVSSDLETEHSIRATWMLGFSAIFGGEFDLAYKAFHRLTPDQLDAKDTTPEFMDRWLGGLCELSFALLETEGNEEYGRELLSASVELYETGFHDDIRHTERYNWSLCYLLAGENDKALDVLGRELDNNFVGIWPWLLRTQPFDAIRGDQRFVSMWEEFERRMNEQLAALRAKDRAKPAFEF